MKRGRTTLWPTVLLSLSACQAAGGISSTAAKVAKPGSDPGCQVEQAGRLLRPGVTITQNMVITNDGRSCIWGAALAGGHGANGLSEQPSHGVVELRSTGDGDLYAYRPTPGYVGSDRFGFVLHRDDGYDDPVLVSVSVRAPGP